MTEVGSDMVMFFTGRDEIIRSMVFPWLFVGEFTYCVKLNNSDISRKADVLLLSLFRGIFKSPKIKHGFKLKVISDKKSGNSERKEESLEDGGR